MAFVVFNLVLISFFYVFASNLFSLLTVSHLQCLSVFIMTIIIITVDYCESLFPYFLTLIAISTRVTINIHSLIVHKY